jgi:hypothetical protein
MGYAAAAPAATGASNQWALVVVLAISITILNWKQLRGKGHPGPAASIASIMLAMGVMGTFLSIVSIGILKDFAGWVASWLQLSPTSSLLPFVCLVISVGARTAQIFEGVDDKRVIRIVLNKVPDWIEWSIITLATVIGGLAVAGAPAWENWFAAWGDLIAQGFVIFQRTVELLAGSGIFHS